MVKVLVLGAGSIGSRHARNLLAAGASVDIMDIDEHRASAVPGAIPRAFNTSKLSSYDGVVVSTPTSLHAEHACAALESGAYVLVEKPLARSALEAAFAEDYADHIMVGYNLRFHQALRDLWALVPQVGRVLSGRFWFGSYLPNWRPIDYRQTYSSQAELGGGVLLDAIHELDLVVWFFGSSVWVRAAELRCTRTLELDVEDVVTAILEVQDGPLLGLSLDYLSRRYRRGIELVGECGTLRLDWARRVIEFEDADGITSSNPAMAVDQSYEREARAFVDFIAEGHLPPVNGSLGLDSLRLADQIRDRSSWQG